MDILVGYMVLNQVVFGLYRFHLQQLDHWRIGGTRQFGIVHLLHMWLSTNKKKKTAISRDKSTVGIVEG